MTWAGVDNRVVRALAALLVVLTILFNLGYKLNDQVVASFDEGRHAASAVEMLRSHDFLINRYQGRPDYYNAKPPLSLWAAALTLTLAPDPFFGVRLFSLLSALATALLVFVYARRLAGYYAGLLAALLLLTVPLLLLQHGARTADPDMLYVALVTGALLAFSGAGRAGMAWGYVLLGLAFLTKSFHALPFAVAAFAYCLGLYWRRRISLGELLLLPLCALLPVLPWAVARYMADGPRFFQVMFFYDLLKRASEPVEMHFTTPMAYVLNLMEAFGPAVLAVVISLFAAPCRRLFADHRFWLVLCWLLLPLLLYSCAQSRLYWYVFPLLPPAAVLIACCVVKGREGLHRVAVAVMLIIVVFNVGMSEQQVLDSVGRYTLHDDPPQEALHHLSAALPRGSRQRVYIDDTPADGLRQGHYATASLLGNIEVMGDAAAYASAAGPGDVLLGADGSLSRKPVAIAGHP